MNHNMELLMMSATNCENLLRIHGHDDAAMVLKRCIKELKDQNDIIDFNEKVIASYKETNRILNHELKGLKAAATEQARIIRSFRERMMDDGH